MDWRLVEDHLRDYFRKEGYSIHTVTGDTTAVKAVYDEEGDRTLSVNINLTELAIHLAREMEYAA